MISFVILLAAAQPVAAPAQPAASAAAVTTASGLRLETLTAGTGPTPEADGAVLVTYEGKLADGTVFDATKEPVGLPVSALIPGFTEALLLMKQGGTYRFRIPPALAYGAQGSPPSIPPNAELEFTVTLYDIGGMAPAGQAEQPPQP